MDPITLAIVAALVGGLAGGVAEGAVGSAYEVLKDALKRKHGNDSKLVQAVNTLEGEPNFEPNRTALAGRVEQAKADKDEELLVLAQQLTAALEKTKAGQQAMAKFHIQAENSEIGNIGDNAHIEGGIHFGSRK